MKKGSRFIFDDQDNGSPNSFKNDSMNAPTPKFNEELTDLEKLFSLFHRHIWTIIFCTLLSISVTYYIVNYYLLPVYQSEGTILITNNESSLPGSSGRNGVNSDIENIISRSFTLNSGNNIQSAIYLFQSRELSEDIARRLKVLFGSDNYKQYPSLWLNYPVDSTTVSIGQAASRIRNKLRVEPIEPESKLRNISHPNLLNVSYQSYSPQEAAEVVNLALDVFQEKSLEQKRNTASKALSFLQEKREEVRTQLNNAENRLVSFQNENELVAIDAQAGNSVNTLSQIQAEKQNLEIQLESVNSSIENYEKQMEAIKPGMADQYSKAVGPTITNYQQRLAELRTQRFVLLSNNPQLKENPNSEPELKKLNQQINELENEIQSLSEGLINDNEGFIGISVTGDGNLAQELSNIQRNLIQLRIEKNQYESQIQVLNQRIKEVQSFLDTYPDKQVKLARLETEVQRHKQLLNTLTSQESEIQLWQQTQNSSGAIVDQANPRFEPVKPNKILWLCFAATVGWVLPIGLLFVKNSVSSVINSSEQLKSFPYPLLSVVYDHSLLKTNRWIFKKNKDIKSSNISKSIVFHHNIDTPIAESYRKIISHILYTNSDSVLQSLLITSSGPGEGKTTLTGNLGAAFAEVDRKVLIVDCDFRRPATHKLFSLDNSMGIKEVLLDGAKLSEAIRETGIQDLYVLPAGAKPASPAKLLASEQFNEMIKVIRPNYDIILFDTSPQGLVSDVASLLNLTDLVIVAAKFGETNKNVLKHTLEELDKKEKSNISLVLTGYKPASSYDSYDTKGLHKYIYQHYYEYEKVNEN